MHKKHDCRQLVDHRCTDGGLRYHEFTMLRLRERGLVAMTMSTKPFVCVHWNLPHRLSDRCVSHLCTAEYNCQEKVHLSDQCIASLHDRMQLSRKGALDQLLRMSDKCITSFFNMMKSLRLGFMSLRSLDLFAAMSTCPVRMPLLFHCSTNQC